MNSLELYRLLDNSKELVKKWNHSYSNEIFAYFQEQMKVLAGIRNNISSFKESANYQTSDLKEFHSNNLKVINTLYTKLKTKSDTKEFIALIKNGLLADIQGLDTKVIDEYNKNAEYTEKGIGSSRFLKNTGNFFYHVRSTPRKIGNGIRKLFKKPVKPLKPRYHTIYYQSIVKGFLLNKYIACVRGCTFEIQKELAQYAYRLFELETSLINSNYRLENNASSLEKIPDLTNQLSAIENFFLEYRNIFQVLLEKSGTWEFPLFYIRYKLKRYLKQRYKLIASTYRLWNSTFYALYEDWRFREELFSFISSIKILAEQTLENYTTKLNKSLIPVINTKKEYLNGLVERIPNPDNTNLVELKHFFTTELYKLQKETRNLTITDDLKKAHIEIKKILQKIEVDVTEPFKSLPKKSGVVRSPDYEKGISKSEIYFFSPVEFIEFECLPPFLKNIKSITGEFTHNFDDIIHEFSDFDQITDFTLDTAVSLVNAQNTADQTILMFREGITRSLNILDHITKLSNETIDNKNLIGAYANFIENAKKLDNNDSILKIYSRLLKSKAREESKDKRRKINAFVLSSVAFLTSFLKKQASTVLYYYKEVRKRLKLNKAPESVSSEISNYLADINRKIYKLPVIYRYLYENTPVKEINLFLSRQTEIDKLNGALKDWKAGNFAATLVIGENGSGKSSLLQNYLRIMKGSYKVWYLAVEKFYYNEQHFYELMQELFDNKKLNNDEKVLEQLNASKGKQIIVLDGLERIFLRKPGGFECLHKLLSFVVSTNNQAFWICSISLHASSYLDKTIALKENFDYLIELNSLSPDEIKNIVLKRHRLSGYLLQYEEDAKHADDNKNTKARQLELETEFFDDLDKFTDSNISLSLYYWLESVSEFTEKELYIQRFHAPDFSFLETLSAEKVFTLLLIVLHGKITVDFHATICNQDKEKSIRTLTILKEDSIVLLKGNYYILNGILYKHVIELLKNKNLIH